MHGTWRDTHPWLFNTYLAPDDGGGDGGDGGGGDGGGQGGDGDKGGKGSEKTLTQSQVDDIVKGRVGETKRQTEEAIAKTLGVPIEEAKRIIEATRAAEDKEKSEATLAREKADREAKEADEAKAAAAKERHEAAVERALIKALPKDLDDDALDKKVARIGRLLDVEVGADADTIKKAVEALKKDEPLLFGVTEDAGGDGGKAPDSDPKGKPPKKKGSEDAFSRGQERAKAATGAADYALLNKS